VGSINPIVEIEHFSPVPLYEQVPAAVRCAVAEGEDRLAPARDPVDVLGVSTNAVLLALRALPDAGAWRSAAGGPRSLR